MVGRVAGVGVALVLLVLVAAPAWGHAALTSVSPPHGEQLETTPPRVELEFNEDVVAGSDALRVFDGTGVRVDDGPLPTDADNELAVGLSEGLEDGAYVVAYRVTSADAHPIAGTTTFTVGDADALDAETVDAIAGLGSGWAGTVGSVLRGIGYAGALTAAGAIVFPLAVAGRPTDRRRTRALAVPAALLAMTATALHLPFQAAAVTGYGPFQVLSQPAAMGEVLSSSFGQAVLVRLVGLALLVLLWRTGRSSRALVGAGLVTIGSYLLDGHQRSIDPTWLLVAGDAVHLIGAAVWLACLSLVVATLRALRAEDRPVEAAAIVARFSRMALWSVLALAVAGTAMAWPLVGGLDALTSTAYGGLLITKLVLVALALAVAGYNRRRLVPRIERLAVPAGAAGDTMLDTATTATGAWQALRRTTVLEVAVLAGVLAVTGFLVGIQPASVAAGGSGPVVATAPFGDDLEVDLVVDPSATGTNTVHVYVLEPSGQPATDVDDLRWEFTYLPEQIGPIVVEPFAAGPGHWSGWIDDLRFAGDWEVRVIGGVGRFDEVETTITFTVHD